MPMILRATWRLGRSHLRTRPSSEGRDGRLPHRTGPWVTLVALQHGSGLEKYVQSCYPSSGPLVSRSNHHKRPLLRNTGNLTSRTKAHSSNDCQAPDLGGSNAPSYPSQRLPGPTNHLLSSSHRVHPALASESAPCSLALTIPR